MRQVQRISMGHGGRIGRRKSLRELWVAIPRDDAQPIRGL